MTYLRTASAIRGGFAGRHARRGVWLGRRASLMSRSRVGEMAAVFADEGERRARRHEPAGFIAHRKGPEKTASQANAKRVRSGDAPARGGGVADRT